MEMYYRCMISSPWKIPKVPQIMRQEEGNKDVFDPKVVSFGPYHHGKPEFQLGEEAKTLALERFVDRSGHDEDYFHRMVLKNINYARSCYIEGSTDMYSNDEFAKMMLLDACLIIYASRMMVDQFTHDEILCQHLGGVVISSMVYRDIFLLENQIPFQVLLLLIYSRRGRAQGEKILNRFLNISFWGNYKYGESSCNTERKDYTQCLHLLEAYHSVFVWDQCREHRIDIKEVKDEAVLKKDLIRFRSATDLRTKGIHMKAGCQKSLKAVKFTSFALYGKLQLPTIFVTNIDQVFYPNMIAYEACTTYNVEPLTIGYISFLKSIIQSPADVKLLREKGILLLSLRSDAEVVTFFKKINTYEWDFALKSFHEVGKQIQRHYDSRSKTWIAEVINKNFSTPWSVIGWFAAFFLLVLTFLQTIYTMKS